MVSKLYGLWSHEEAWFYLFTTEIFWTKHKRIAEAQLVKLRRLYGKDWGNTWSTQEIGENGMPVFEFEPLEWDYERTSTGDPLAMNGNDCIKRGPMGANYDVLAALCPGS